MFWPCPPPFPSELSPADHPLPGEPSLVLLGSGGWLPNREGTRWFLEEVWPEIRAKVPGALLHLFAAERDRPEKLPAGVVPHPPPADTRDAFAPNAILVVPLRIASGIRMKILEAWARGVPVVATPEAAAGLEVEEGREMMVASSGEAFTQAVAAHARPQGTHAEEAYRPTERRAPPQRNGSRHAADPRVRGLAAGQSLIGSRYLNPPFRLGIG